jgi:sugar/nucleoside kinase (ribokinase family)
VLCTVGDLIEDVVVWLDEPFREGTDTSSRVTRTRGGSAANVAQFAACNGTAARFVGCVGDDPLGESLVGQLARLGVDVQVQRRGRTGSIIVIVHQDGERSMLTDRGAATELLDVDTAVLDGVRILHIPAYSLVLEPIASSAVALARVARERGVSLSIDASSAAVLEHFGADRFRNLIEEMKPTYLLCNDDEARVLQADEGVRGSEIVVIKRGAEPVTVITKDSRVEIAVPKVAEIRDTTGAGDAFAAGFLGALLSGSDLQSAIEAGTALASRVLSSPGATLEGR